MRKPVEITSKPLEGMRPQTGLGSLTLARTYLQTGALEEAAESVRRILENNPAESVEANLVLAEVLRLQGRHQDASALAGQISEPTDSRLFPEWQLLQARLLTEAGQYETCAKRFDFDLRSHATCAEDVMLASVVAECKARLKELSSSRTLVEWAISEAGGLDWSEGVADGLMSLALLDRIEGQWPRADGFLLKAREIYSQSGLSRKYVLATLNLALQRLWRGHLTFANEALKKEAERLAVEGAEIRLEATARMDRGLALVRLSRHAEARQEMAKALRLCRRQASPRRVAIALEYTGELHIAAHDYVRASAALRRSLAIAARIAPEGDIVPEVLRRQAEVAVGLGHAKDALRIAQDAGERAARLGDQYERATSLRVQGEALRALSREEEAVRVLREALQVLEDLGETFERDRIFRLLGEPSKDEQPGAVEETPDPHPSGQTFTCSGTITTADARRLLRKHGMIGSSRRLVDVMREAAQIAPLKIPVLIQGETGTGKELLACAIHKLGQPSRDRLVAFNCATCPPDLLDAELFGYTRGAFTGANESRLGLVRSAEGGTLFLDEIGEMREESQARLLRLLDSGEMRPLGSDRARKIKVRILAATHVDLEDQIRLRRFRRDLYFRLAGIRLVIPPLRERQTDLRELAAHFVQEAREDIRPAFAGFSEKILQAMERYDWPGNVRQLRLEILRCAALATDGVVVDRWTPCNDEVLPRELVEPREAAAILQDPVRLRKLIVEKRGQMAPVARVLGVSRGHLYRVLKRMGIPLSEFR